MLVLPIAGFCIVLSVEAWTRYPDNTVSSPGLADLLELIPSGDIVTAKHHASDHRLTERCAEPRCRRAGVV
jgi:hypothetical protein